MPLYLVRAVVVFNVNGADAEDAQEQVAREIRPIGNRHTPSKEHWHVERPIPESSEKYHEFYRTDKTPLRE